MMFRFLAAILTASSVVAACTNCTNASPEPIELAPAPWTLKGDVYGLFLLPGFGIPLLGHSIPTKAFPPLERKYPESIAGNYKGKVGMIQAIRYTDSPVGPYDELLIVPGFFEYENQGKSEQSVRVSRIYVSQKYTAYNGRANWNIPKHLARFDWTFTESGTATVKIYPYDTTGDLTESYPAEKPFFQMTFTPIPADDLLNNILSAVLPGAIPKGLDLTLDFPLTTNIYKILGIDATLVQPPLPRGNDSFGALATGGPEWKSVVPGQDTTDGSIGLVDMDQSGGDGEKEGVNAVGDEFFRNFWPGLPAVNVGVRLRDAVITFSEATELPDVVVE